MVRHTLSCGAHWAQPRRYRHSTLWLPGLPRALRPGAALRHLPAAGSRTSWGKGPLAPLPVAARLFLWEAIAAARLWYARRLHCLPEAKRGEGARGVLIAFSAERLLFFFFSFVCVTRRRGAGHPPHSVTLTRHARSFLKDRAALGRSIRRPILYGTDAARPWCIWSLMLQLPGAGGAPPRHRQRAGLAGHAGLGAW